MARRRTRTSPASQPSAAHDENDRNRRTPTAVVKRLSLYSRVLQALERDKVEKVSSSALARLLGLNSAQVRKDLATFGEFGVPGFGYRVADLRRELRTILGTNRENHVALVGVGHLGTALVSYGGFARQGFRIVCAFDKVVPGRALGPDRVPVFPIEELETRLRGLDLRFAILAVPSDAAQAVADRLVASGVDGILNFVPVRLHTPHHVKVHDVDLALEMESLCFYLKGAGDDFGG
jgi:redox-sensing transcriptional repressor